MVLKWTNPPLETFEQVRIVRKEGEAPQSLEDGEEVYTGRFPIFQDHAVEEGREYHYLVVVEDCYGTLSQGRRISIKTDPPQVDEIRLEVREGGGIKWLEDILTMTVGDKLWFSAVGWKNGTSVNIAPKWEIEQEDEVISLRHEQGDQNEIRALLPGRAVITGYLPESFGSKPVTLTVIVEE